MSARSWCSAWCVAAHAPRRHSRALTVADHGIPAPVHVVVGLALQVALHGRVVIELPDRRSMELQVAAELVRPAVAEVPRQPAALLWICTLPLTVLLQITLAPALSASAAPVVFCELQVAGDVDPRAGCRAVLHLNVAVDRHVDNHTSFPSPP